MFYIYYGVSKKNNRGYYALCVDLGYTQKFLSFDDGLIADILGVSRAELYGAQRQPGERIPLNK